MNRPRILCVDDEPFILEALSRQLRRDYDVVVATDGPAALAQLAAAEFAVIMSDLRMPGMDGVQLLHRAREVSPDTVRLLLTGFADIEAAIDVVNEAQIFRFLTKPCPREQLLGALGPAVEQYRLITAERVLLEETLQGSVRALVDALALANPMVFGRANRVKRDATQLVNRIETPNRWEVEVAAMLSQIGMLSLPATTIEKLFLGRELAAAEQESVNRLPAVTDQLLAHVPRLEGVRQILRDQHCRFDGSDGSGRQGDALPLGARLLKVVVDFDVLESQGVPIARALDVMRSRRGWYDPQLLAELAEIRGVETVGALTQILPLCKVATGMRFLDDVKTRTGLLLIPKGFEVNAALLERLRSYDPAVLDGQVRVLVGALAN